MTVLGFVTTLLSASLPIAECKKYVFIYAIAHPLAALLSCIVKALLGIVPTNESERPLIVFMNSLTVSPVVLLLPFYFLLINVSGRFLRLRCSNSVSFDCQLSNNA